MTRNFIIHLAVLYCIFTAGLTVARAAGDGIRVSRFDIEDGLSQNTVLSIIQDRKGDMWFATNDGLTRYDGYDFTVFRHSARDTSSIADNNVRLLFIDSSDRLWVGTAYGLCRYDSSLENFDSFGTGTGLDIYALEEISGDRLLVGTSDRMFVFDISSGCFSDTLPAAAASLRARSMVKYGGSIFIGCADGELYEYSISDSRFNRINVPECGKPVQYILIQEPGILWAGTEGDGLYRIILKDGTVTNFRYDEAPGHLGSNYVRALANDSEGRLWVGTFNCLNIFDPVSETFASYTNDPFDDESLSQNSVRSLYYDRQGGMWLGTFYGGVNYWHPLKERFTGIRRKPDGSTLNDNIISCIVEDPDGMMWVGTNNGGVNGYNPETGKFIWYSLVGNRIYEDVESDDIKAIFIDGDRVYVGAHAGRMKYIDKRDGAVQLCGRNSGTASPVDIYSIIRKDGTGLWVGTLNGLYVYDTVKDSFTEITEDADGTRTGKLQIRILMTDSGGRLWAGCETGLKLFDCTGSAAGGKDSGLHLISAPADGLAEITSSVFSIKESSSGTIWIGTGEGLYCYIPGKGEILLYTTEDGLPSDIIHGIEEDSFGRLWISTDNGLSCLNPYSDSFRNYSTADGLTSNQFTTYAHCRRASGEMWFGSINGITLFTPERLTDNPYTPEPVISQLQIFNTAVRPGDDTGILDRSIRETRKIKLKHSYNSFSLQFTVADYIGGRHNTFAYMLEGIDKEWQYTTGNRSASYSMVPQGRYRFMVKAANNDGKWCPRPAVLDIKVLPVWYETIWAQILFFAAAASLIIGGIRFYLERKSMEARLEIDRKDREHQEEIHQMKMRFFINISHELRTPLTLIITPLQEMIPKASDVWMRKQLKYVYRNAQRLLHLVNQLMDYRRAELGVFKLKVRKEDAYRIVKENWSYYEKLAESKKIRYTLDSSLEGQTVFVDGQYLELILNNLISNAFKYTDSGRIDVRAKIDGTDFILEVNDTGIGIPVDKQARIFERFYQVEKQHIGSGIGLSLVQRLVELHHGQIEITSEEGKGSSFKVTIPQTLETYSSDELDLAGDGANDVHTTNPKEMYILDTDSPEEGYENTEGDKGWTVLVADDNKEIREYIKAGLESTFNIIIARNGKEALEIIGKETVDIVITDVIMPVMDGIQLCRQIKHDISTSHIPVIMLSAKTDVEEQLEAFHTGADDYIGKPFSMAVLLSKIQNMQKTRLRMLERYSRSVEVEPEKITFNRADEELLKQAIDIVEKNLDNSEFSIQEFADGMGMSRSNLHMKLKAITGESALEFIRKIRFREACRMLREGQYSISEISYKVGFSTPSYFATSFKKHFGCLPSEYVKGNK